MGIVYSFRTAGGHRRFQRQEVERLRAERTGEAGNRWVDLIRSESDPLIISAELLRTRASQGSWWRVADALGEALHEMGRLWETGEVSVLDEHMASERLERAIQWSAQTIPLATDSPAALLAMASGDDHTLGLSLAEITLREAGWNARWAGRRTPIDTIIAAIHHREVQMIVLSASCILKDQGESLRKLYENIANACRVADVRLILGGQGAWPDDPPYGDRLHSFAELNRLLCHEEAA